VAFSLLLAAWYLMNGTQCNTITKQPELEFPVMVFVEYILRYLDMNLVSGSTFLLFMITDLLL
jgi:hypothetical protein